MPKRLECIITGKVQGVFFRDFVKTQADALGIFGYVKNNSDGTVSIISEGEEKKLKNFLAAIKTGTDYARVDQIDENWPEPTGEFSGFEIRI